MKKIVTLIALPLFIPQLALAQAAPAFSLSWPLACKPNIDCFVNHYPDLQMGTAPSESRDYRCGMRTEPGQTGVDIRFRDNQTALRSQKVLAMAPGRVVYVKDNFDDNTDGRIARRSPCGNEVQIMHANGYQTRYCHLRQGSARVQAGQSVKAGDVLAMVGASGETKRPELTIYLSQDGYQIDPFTGRALNAPGDCYKSTDKSLWNPDIPYAPALITATGFANYLPTQEDVENGLDLPNQVAKDSAHLAAWVQIFGLQKNDHEVLEIRDPSGEVWQKLDRYSQFDAPEWLTFVQGSRAEKDFPKGVWTADYSLVRDGRTILQNTVTVEVK